MAEGPENGRKSAPEAAPGAEPVPGSQLALFVVWERGRRAEGRILADLVRRFEVIRVAEVRWSPRRAPRNFERFYCDLDVRGVYHVHNKGAGSSLAVVLRDLDPKLQLRATTRGQRLVNAAFLDAKSLYREWTGEFAVHCSETQQEAHRDVLMLLGESSLADARTVNEPWNGEVEMVERDVSGAGGWATVAEVFGALNASVTYVLLGDAVGDRPWHRSDEPQILTYDYATMRNVLDARPVAGARLPRSGTFRMRVAGRWVRFGIRTPHGGYLDPEWSRACLEGRVFDRDHGLHHAAPSDALATYVYMNLVHRRRVPADFSMRLRRMAAAQSGTEWSYCDPDDLADVGRCLGRFLDERGYRYTRPLDPGVRSNPALLGDDGTRRRFRRVAAIVRGARERSYLGARDWIVMRAPWVRRVKAAALGCTRTLRHPAASLRRLIRGEALKRAILLVRGGLFVGRRYQCPCCGWSLRGFVGRWGFFRSNPDGYCPRCNAKARHRRAWLYLQASTDGADLPVRILDIAPWWSFARAARNAGRLDYVGMDIRRTGRHVDIVGDVTAIPSPDGAYDVVVCVHVLEHVEEDRAAMAEIFRVLRPGGFALISVPLRPSGATHEDASITDPEERLRTFGERSHVRAYGLDLEDRLREAGFDVGIDLASTLSPTIRRRFGLRDDDHIFHGSKAMPGSASWQ